MSSCLRKTRTVLSMAKALVCRGMFVLHGLICIWRVTVIKSDIVYWSLAGSLPLIIMETAFTLCKKKNMEWKWICPSVLLYLATSVPAIWFLELDVMAHRRLLSDIRRENATTSHVANDTEQIQLLNGETQFHLDISMGSEEWCKVLEQILLLVLIVGRWLLPKGEITREQLSQLLLVYIGMAADIIELFEAFKEDKVREDKILNITILSLWTASLTQFTLVLTATKSKQRRTSCVVQGESGGGASCTNGLRGCCPAEVLSILLSVFLQDAPFLVLRLLLIFRYNVLSYSNIFFTSKNSLVLVLQIYRLIVLFTDSPAKPPAKTKPRNRQVLVTTGSSGSNSLSFTSDSDASCSECSDFGNTSEGSDWTKLHRLKGHRGILRRPGRGDNSKSDSGSSIDTDLDSIPGTSLKDRKTVLVMTASKHATDPSSQGAKGKGKLPMKAAGGMWVCSYQRRPCKLERSKTDGGKRVKTGGRYSESDYPSPVLPPPPPEPLAGTGAAHDIVGTCSTSIISNNNNNNSSNNNNNNNNNNSNNNYNTVGKGKGRLDTKSPKASPSRSQRNQSKDGKHLHDNQRHHGHDRGVIPTSCWHRSSHEEEANDPPRSYGGGSRSRGQGHHHWSSIKSLQSVLTLLERKGKYRTVVLKHAGDGTPVYVIDRNKHNRHDISV